MISNPLLYLLVERLSALRSPGSIPDDSDFEHQHLDRLLAERAPGDVSWHDVVLNAYVTLERPDLAAIPTRAHHWFLEQLTSNAELRRTREDFFKDLYDLLDPVGRFLTIRALARSGEGGSQELVLCTERITARDESHGRRRTAELTNLLVDVWLSEDDVSVKNERRHTGRSMPLWFRRAIDAGLFTNSSRAQVEAILRQRGEQLDHQTAEQLKRLSEGR